MKCRVSNPCSVVSLMLMLVIASAVRAQTLRLGDFEVPAQPVLQVVYKGTTIIERDSWDLAAFPDGGIVVSPDGQGFTYLFEANGNSFRREVCLTDGGLEITASMRAANLFGRNPDNLYAYEFLMPPRLFTGQRPFAVYGRQDKYNGRTFDLSRPIGVGESYSGRFRHMSFKVGADTVNLDMSPMGPPLGYTTNHDLSYGARPTMSDGLFALRFYRFVSHFGGDLTCKTVIRIGENDYHNHHHLQVGHYTAPFEHERSIDFTTGAESVGFTPCADAAFDMERGFGWKSGDVRVQSFGQGGPLKRDAAVGFHPAEFQVALRPGFYLLNYVLYNPIRAVGTFSVSIDGKPALESVFAGKGQLRYLSATFYADSATTVIGFDGDWQVNALEFTPVFHKTEDFSISRPFWNMTGR